MPTTDRDLNFRATVRDGNGGVNSDDVLLTVVDTGTGFAVTSSDNWTGGAPQTITWDVAGTDANGINAANVNILLSTDGGLTFPFTLASGVPNNGSHSLTAPNINTTTARVKIEAAGNVFFDISDADFSITADSGAPGVTLTQTDSDTRVVEDSGTDTYDISLNSAPAGDVTIQIEADGQSEISIDGGPFASSQTVVLNSTAAQTITVRAIGDAVEEGPHTSLLTHSVTSSTSGTYPVDMLIDNFVVNIDDDELPAVIGVDFDFDIPPQPTPTNWTQSSFFADVTMFRAMTDWPERLD